MSERGNGFLRFLDFWAGIPLVFLTASLRKFARRKIPKSPERICILCQGAMGDLLLLSGLINALHDKFPAACLDLLLSHTNAGAASLLYHIHNVHVFSIKRPDKIILFLRRQNYDLLIDSSQWARLGAIISNCSASSCTIGFNTSGQYRHFGYDVKVKHHKGVHETENFLTLGKKLWPDLRGECSLRIGGAGGEFGSDLAGRMICLHMWPSGIKRYLKEWPREYWADLAVRLLDAGYTVILTGGKEDKEKTEKFMRDNFSSSERIFSLSGQATLAETARVISRCAALVSVNTGIMHMGALAGIPTVGLHGPTNPLRWGPVGKKCKALLPQSGVNAYLHLGFEYPANAPYTLSHLPVSLVLQALASLGIKI